MTVGQLVGLMGLVEILVDHLVLCANGQEKERVRGETVVILIFF